MVTSRLPRRDGAKVHVAAPLGSNQSSGKRQKTEERRRDKKKGKERQNASKTSEEIKATRRFKTNPLRARTRVLEICEYVVNRAASAK